MMEMFFILVLCVLPLLSTSQSIYQCKAECICKDEKVMKCSRIISEKDTGREIDLFTSQATTHSQDKTESTDESTATIRVRSTGKMDIQINWREDFILVLSCLGPMFGLGFLFITIHKCCKKRKINH